jgi:hypothetical protein
MMSISSELGLIKRFDYATIRVNANHGAILSHAQGKIDRRNYRGNNFRNVLTKLFND